MIKTNLILIIAITFLFSSCLVSRLSRPAITGTIVDFNNNPIPSCAVGETFTDEKGNFSLEEKRYREIAFIGGEAPPLFVSERIEKKGYKTKEIKLFSHFGGGARKGSNWELDTIYLKSTIQEIDLNKLIQKQWQLSATKNFDTLFLVKKEFYKICKTRKCRDFYGQYSSYTDYAHSKLNNLPNGVIQRFIDIQFMSNNIIKAKMITSYGNKGVGYEETKPKDTLEINGSWILNKKSIELTSAYKELNGKFNFNQAEYEYIKLIK